MRSVTYSMGASLDGYIVGPDGDITADAIWLDAGCILIGRPHPIRDAATG